MKEEYFASFDVGGTKTRCILGTRTDILSSTQRNSGNFYGAGKEEALRNIREALEEAADKARVPLSRVAGLTLAGAGCGKEENRKIILSVLKALCPNAKIKICNDSDVLLSRGSGIALIAGTGSICFFKDEDGNTLRSGGFGWRLGDEGSAFHMAKEAVRRTLRSKEKLDLETEMGSAILSHFHSEKLSDVIYVINDPECRKEDIASFAPAVTEAAENGDKLARDISEKESDELILLVKSIIRRAEGKYEKRIIVSGGLLLFSSFYRSLFEAKAKKEFPDFTLIYAYGEKALLLSLETARNL